LSSGSRPVCESAPPLVYSLSIYPGHLSKTLGSYRHQLVVSPHVYTRGSCL
jgi:hypothetical protein